MISACKKCAKKHDGWQGSIKPLCLECFAEAKGLDGYYQIRRAYCRTGRPKGSTQYETAKINDTHRMTPLAHAFIAKNKRLIEEMARRRHEVQYKLL